MTGVVALAVVLGLSTVFGLVWQRRTGRLRTVAQPHLPTAHGHGHLDPAPDLPHDALPSDLLSRLGVELGPQATLVQFSSAFCRPCVATRQVLAEVVGMVDGVAHVEVDAEAHLDEVRELHILKTPTVLVLDRFGRVVKRASGQPRKADVIAALGEVVA